MCVDVAIGQVQQACEKNGYVLLVTADHGNAERMIDEAGKPVTKHTTFRGMYCELEKVSSFHLRLYGEHKFLVHGILS